MVNQKEHFTISVSNDSENDEIQKEKLLLSVWKVRFAKEILQRAENYYKSGNIKSICFENGKYSAIVTGSKDYHVDIVIQNQRLVSSECDCPNAINGYLCKHMAAVLMAIENGDCVKYATTLQEKVNHAVNELNKQYPDGKIDYPLTNIQHLYKLVFSVARELSYPNTNDFCYAHGFSKKGRVPFEEAQLKVSEVEKELFGDNLENTHKLKSNHKQTIVEQYKHYSDKMQKKSETVKNVQMESEVNHDYSKNNVHIESVINSDNSEKHKINVDSAFNNVLLDKKVKYWQQQLLDHGKRNKMMHFRETARTTLNITSPRFDELYTKIVVNDQTLSFRRPIGKNDDSRMYSLLQLVKELDSSIEFANGDIQTTGSYQNCAAACRNLKSKAQLALDEQGTNILYLCFGFIEWKKKDYGKKNEDIMKSPLILVPVKINTDSLISPFQLKRRDDDIVVNPTLSHLFEETYKIKLPLLEPNPKLQDVLRFMEEVEEIATSRGWRITRECCIGLMSFLKITMYNDMVKNEQTIKSNPIIRAFAGDVNSVNTLNNVNLSFNHDELSTLDSYQVLDADSSQQDAIELSRNGISFVLQGPPGTGKSQTITNIIAEGLASGKKILFVSEKLAALEVVYKRLKDTNLDKFCLPLHNHKANKKQIINEIGRNLQLDKVKIKNESMVKLMELDNLKIKLNQYIHDIYEPIQPLGSTLYEIYGAIAELDDIPTIATKISHILNLSRSDFFELMMLIKSYDSARLALGDQWQANPWFGSKINLFNNVEKEVLLTELNTEHKLLMEVSKIFVNGKAFTSFISLNNLDVFVQLKNELKGCKNLPHRWFVGKELHENLEQERSLLIKLKGAYDANVEANAQILDKFDNDFISLNGIEMAVSMKQAMAVLNFIYSNSDSNDLLIRKEYLREQLTNLIEVLSSLRVVASELHKQYGFDNDVPLDVFNKYIQIIQISHNKYPFTEYYFGDDVKDVKEAATISKQLMDEIDKKKYLINKEYFKTVYADATIESYLHKLISVKSIIEKTCPSDQSQLSFMKKAIKDDLNVFEQKNEIIQNQYFYELLLKYRLPIRNSVNEIEGRITALKNLIDDGKGYVRKNSNYHQLIIDARTKQEELKELKKKNVQLSKKIHLNLELIKDYEALSLFKGDFNGAEIFLKASQNSDAFIFLDNLKSYNQSKNEKKAILHRLRNDLGIKNSLSENDLVEMLKDLSTCVDNYYVNESWGYGKDIARQLLEKQSNLAKKLVELRNNLEQKYGKKLFMVDTNSMLNRFKYEYTGLFKSFNKAYKDDYSLIDEVLGSKSSLKDSDIIAILEEMEEYNQLNDIYMSASKSVEIYLGISEYSINFDWNIVKKQLDCFEKIESLIENPLRITSIVQDGSIKKLINAALDYSSDNRIDELSSKGESLFGNLYSGEETNIDYLSNEIKRINSLLKIYSDKDSFVMIINSSQKDEIIDEIIETNKSICRNMDWFNDNLDTLKSAFGIENPIDYEQYDDLLNNLNRISALKKVFGHDCLIDSMNNDEMNVILSCWEKMLSLAKKIGYSGEDSVENALYTQNNAVNTYRYVIDIYEQLNSMRFRDIESQSIDTIINELQTIHDVRNDISKMNTIDTRNKQILGEAYESFDTNWHQIEDMISAAETILSTFGGKLDRKLQRVLLNREVLCDEDYYKSLELKNNEYQRFSENIQHLSHMSIDEMINVFEDGVKAIDFMQYCQEKVAKYCVENMAFTDIVDSMESLGKFKESSIILENIKSECSTLLPEFDLIDAINISSALSTVNHVKSAKKIMVQHDIDRRLIEWMTSTTDNLLNVFDIITSLETDKLKFLKFVELFDDSDSLKNMNFADLKTRIEQCIKYYGMVGQTIDLKACEKKCIENGLGDFIQTVNKNDKYFGKLDKIFTKSFYYAWLTEQTNNLEVLKSFKKAEQNENVKQFANLDKDRIKIARQRINEKLIARMPNRDAGVGKGEVSILINEMDKKQGHMSIRKLFEKIPTLLLQLKPCLMMSPLSVSYFLESDAYKFDMVIFDEASQIFPQDAIGAISRGKQVIIVGDTKQLPPTNFFNAKAILGEEYSDDEEDDVTVVSDSILEEANNHLISRSLLWHYRSKNESLISFSNREIYNNNLITFPSSRKNANNHGVEYFYVSNGRYNRQVNEEEARMCVKLVKEHIETHPNRSLGIIAFSEKQQELIEDRITKWRLKNKQYEFFFSDAKDEPFFVKNLENVQGDERDTIIFSICYAKDNNGTLYYRFGPLGASGGERRLNVAVTRAKYNIKLVGSLLPDDIDLNRVSSEGVKQLRKYIDYAMNGVSALKQDKSTSSYYFDPFIQSVAEFIKESGYEVVVNVGDSDYKVNIGVVDPKDKNRFIAGIECDGETYRMARTSTDRDDLRPRVLSGLGWKTYHVWSAEWTKNLSAEKKSLINFIKKVEKENGESVL